jgi:U2 small nuclear ribonucleoprotein B''
MADTLYVNNLNDGIHPDILQRKLIPMFERYGKIVDVVAMKSLFRRGQMFVIFANPGPAAKSKEALQGQVIFGKPMNIAFARSPSDATLKRRDEEITRQRKPRSSAAESQRRLLDILAEKRKNMEIKPSFAVPLRTRLRKTLHDGLVNKTLLVENVPTDESAGNFTLLFSGFPGFVGARLIAVRGIGFVDFNADFQATVALAAVNGREVSPGVKLTVSYAKK